MTVFKTNFDFRAFVNLTADQSEIITMMREIGFTVTGINDDGGVIATAYVFDEIVVSPTLGIIYQSRIKRKRPISYLSQNMDCLRNRLNDLWGYIAENETIIHTVRRNRTANHSSHVVKYLEEKELANFRITKALIEKENADKFRSRLLSALNRRRIKSIGNDGKRLYITLSIGKKIVKLCVNNDDLAKWEAGDSDDKEYKKYDTPHSLLFECISSVCGGDKRLSLGYFKYIVKDDYYIDCQYKSLLQSNHQSVTITNNL